MCPSRSVLLLLLATPMALHPAFADSKAATAVAPALSATIAEAGPISPLPPLHMTAYPPEHWNEGRWYHGDHDHRSGWWWIAGDRWFWYAAPIYPSPDPYLPPAIAAPPASIRYWYWCDRPAGYYPYVSSCEQSWRPLPAMPPPPPVH